MEMCEQKTSNQPPNLAFWGCHCWFKGSVSAMFGQTWQADAQGHLQSMLGEHACTLTLWGVLAHADWPDP